MPCVLGGERANEEQQRAAAEEPAAEEANAPEMSAPETGGTAHSEEHLTGLQEQCMRAKSNDAYCACSVSAITEHTSGEHFATHDDGRVSVGEIPEDASKAMQNAIIACEAEHIAEEAAADMPHKDEHLAQFKTQCMAEKDNEAFCDCGVAAIAEHLPGQHVEADEDGTVGMSVHAPTGTSHTVQEAVAACEAEHNPAPEEAS